jgi:long-chain fatty acid transport protein
VDYPDGSFSTRALGAGIIGTGGPFENIYNGISDEYLKGSSLYLAVSIGGTYRLSKTISVAGGIRSLSVANSIEGGLTLTDGLLGPLTQDVPLKVDVKESGQGWGGVVGIQVKPVDGLNVALHCETPIKLRLETDIREGDNISEEAGLFMDGQESRRDFPAMIGLGASYRFIPEFRGEVNFNYWFQKAADWGKAQNGDDMSNLAGDSWSIGTACAYMLTPRLEISSGVLYTWYDFGDIDEYYSNSLGAIEVFYADDVMYSVGFGYEVVTGLTLNFGIGWIFYKSETVKTPQGEVKMSNTSSSAMALGVDYSF